MSRRRPRNLAGKVFEVDDHRVDRQLDRVLDLVSRPDSFLANSIDGASIRTGSLPANRLSDELRPAFNVIRYGADPFGQKDSASAFAQAISLANDQGGGVVVVPPGDYLVTDHDSDGAAIKMETSVTLSGSGAGATTITLGDGEDVDVLFADTKSDIGVRELTVDGNQDNNTSGCGIRLLSGQGGSSFAEARIQNVIIRSPADHGIFFEQDSVTPIFWSNVVEDVWIYYPGGDGIRFDGDDADAITANRISGVSIFLAGGSEGNGIRLYGDHFVVSGVIVEGVEGSGYAGIDYQGGKSSTLSDLSVVGVGSSGEQDDGRGVFLGSTESVTVRGMTADNLGEGVFAFGSTNTSISGVVTNNCYYGVAVAGGAPPTSTAISGCTFADGEQGIRVGQATATTITGCNSRGNAEGLRVLSTAAETTVVANNFTGNTAATEIDTSASGTIDEHNALGE